MEREKEIEERIIKYKYIDQRIKVLELELEKQRMAGAPRDIGAIDYSKVGGKGGSNGKSAEIVLTNAQDIIYQINKLKLEKETMESFFEVVKDNSKEEWIFIQERYFKKKQVEDVLESMGYSFTSRRVFYQIREKVFDRYEDYML